MSVKPQPIGAQPGAIPELDFSVEDASTLAYAVVPTIVFRLRVESRNHEPVRSAQLDIQLQIAARRRPYDDLAQKRLAEIFGTADRWATTLRTLPWTRTTLVIPQFEDSTVVDVAVPCTYDLEVVASRYFNALQSGEIPLEFLFSGTVFYGGAGGMLQMTRISWEKEAEYAMPVSVWRETMDRYFPKSAWLRVSDETLERLDAYKSQQGAASWDAALDSLLPPAEET